MFGSFSRSLSARRPLATAAPPSDQTLAILVGARALLARGWVQGAWYVMAARDGRRRVVGAGSLTARSFGEIVQSCLVGAVAESARWHSPERGTAGSAIDALWRELGELEGRAVPEDPWTPTPVLRDRQVRDLTTWNDRRERTQAEVVRLLDAAITRRTPTSGTRTWDQSSSSSSAAAREAPFVGTGR